MQLFQYTHSLIIRFFFDHYQTNDQHVEKIELHEYKIELTEGKSSKSEDLYRRLFEHIPLGLYTTSQDGTILEANPALVMLLGFPDKENLLVINVKELYINPDDDQSQHALLNKDGVMHEYEMQVRRYDGKVIWVKDTFRAVKDEDGKVLLFEGSLEDITQRKQAEQRILHLTRLYATLSHINQTIVRVSDQTKLFPSICKVAVDHGKFGLAWIGMIDRVTGQVTPVAIHGEVHDELPYQTIPLNEMPFKSELMSLAVNSGEIAYSRDIQTDANMSHWWEMADAGGFHAAAAIPFRLQGEIVGLLNLYATDVEFFENEEQHNLLKEMALDISFALDNIEREKQRKQANEALRESEERYRKTLDSMLEGCQIIGFDWRYLYVNDAVARHGRRTKAELIGKTMMEVYPGIGNTEMFAVLQRCMVERIPSHMENEFKYPDGSSGWFELSVQPVRREFSFSRSISPSASKLKRNYIGLTARSKCSVPEIRQLSEQKMKTNYSMISAG